MKIYNVCLITVAAAIALLLLGFFTAAHPFFGVVWAVFCIGIFLSCLASALGCDGEHP